ncbi:hypothetical protein HPB47_000024 [Ixodes persulcatus]|uniref:Uncharacterized protein n=1 Tax=Ixodes persulcatus TaxID=34615 RepID=A0AC60PUP0_IXOPE|nr:hypothetical protein HPB47_000024 [Ixodes persulcatus]
MAERSKDTNFYLEWVPGHSGILGQDRAEREAKAEIIFQYYRHQSTLPAIVPVKQRDPFDFAPHEAKDVNKERRRARLNALKPIPPALPTMRLTLFPGDVSPRVYYKRHASGNVLSSQTRQCVLNVYSWIRRQYQEKNVVEVINLTAAATGISVSSVYEIKRGFKRANGAVKSPSKKRPKFAEKRKRIANHDTCTLTAVGSCLHNFFRRGEIPTLKKIATRLQEDDVLTSCSGATLYSLLKDMGFEKQKRNRNSFLIERQDIVEWRRWYLGAIGKHRAQNRKIYFQDET